ncbi:hypothetical protein LCGC14_1130730 [marine sediment metagenome]|uniref:Uncharacterized protein n=1 Tax=marine sediment metagenome TaxID=412755 RepID=A0A0F9M606_9ZZZZ
MRRKRFSEEQIIRILGEHDQILIAFITMVL